MRNILFMILQASAIMVFLVSCQYQKDTFHPTGSGKLINSSECKSLRSPGQISDVADTLSCVGYIYDPSNQKVFMKHINAGFNCCPLSLSCEISFSNDTIIIRELEQDHACNCECLFDLDLQLDGIHRIKYIVRFIEPYAEGQEQLIFEMDLSSGNEGEYCAVRKEYPWGD
jgi:hypothetical protein